MSVDMMVCFLFFGKHSVSQTVADCVREFAVSVDAFFGDTPATVVFVLMGLNHLPFFKVSVFGCETTYRWHVDVATPFVDGIDHSSAVADNAE